MSISTNDTPQQLGTGEDRQAFAVPLDGLPEGVTALPFPAQGCTPEELASFFGDLEGAIGEACDG